MRNRVIIGMALGLSLALGTAACSSTAQTAGSYSTQASTESSETAPVPPRGLRDVYSPVCTKAELHQANSGFSAAYIHIKGTQPGFVNTHKTAVEVKLGALLVVTIKERDTIHLAVSSGCWVKHESRVSDGVMRVVFLMNRVGYPALVDLPFPPYSAGNPGQITYLHVVRQ